MTGVNAFLSFLYKSERENPTLPEQASDAGDLSLSQVRQNVGTIELRSAKILKTIVRAKTRETKNHLGRNHRGWIDLPRRMKRVAHGDQASTFVLQPSGILILDQYNQGLFGRSTIQPNLHKEEWNERNCQVVASSSCSVVESSEVVHFPFHVEGIFFSLISDTMELNVFS